jgi:predicted outer membrane repeat protein
VSSWTELKDTVEAATGELVLCPFDINKDEKDPLEVTSGLTISCRKQSSDDVCKISGEGVYVSIRSAETTVVQGLRLEDSVEHAVTVRGVSNTAVHSFCECEFVGNHRKGEIRGGAFKTEEGSGIIHLESCYFEDNSASFGAAIYTRSNMMYVIDSIFVRNRADVSAKRGKEGCS